MSAVNQERVQVTRAPQFLLLGLGSRLGLATGLPATLKPKQYLRSENGQYILKLGKSGELALNRVSDAEPQWAISGARHINNAELRLNPDASLSITDSKTGQTYWTSGAQNFSGPAATLMAVVTDDGFLNVSDAAGKLIWSSKGVPNRPGQQPHNTALRKPTDALLESALAEADGIGMLRMGDDETGTLHPIGGGNSANVMVYIRNQNDPILATLYIDGDASRRLKVRLEKQTHSNYRVFMA
jgi:hypothetical protein